MLLKRFSFYFFFLFFNCTAKNFQLCFFKNKIIYFYLCFICSLVQFFNILSIYLSRLCVFSEVINITIIRTTVQNIIYAKEDICMFYNRTNGQLIFLSRN